MFGVSGPAGRAYVRLYRSTNQTLSHGTTTPIQFTSATGNLKFLGRTVTTGTYDSVFAPWTGLYLFVGNAQFAANSTGSRNLQLAVGGTTPIRYANTEPTPSASAASFVVLQGAIYLNKGQFMQFSAQQSSGGDLDLVSSGTTHNYTPFLEVVYLGDL